jgi:Fe-S-cluster containining protein
MTLEASRPPGTAITCDSCEACCCRLEVLLLTDTGVPQHYIKIDQWGGMTMARLDDGWCAALNRNTLMCMIYEKRPLVCREFEMGSAECIVERGGGFINGLSTDEHG